MKILIVEDVDCLRKSLLDYFREEGFECDAAADGESGLACALEGDYDAVILALMHPGMNEFEVLSHLRAAGRKVPVLLLTAWADLPDRRRGLRAGADDHLAKPFEMEELLARVRALIRREGRGASVAGNSGLAI